LLIGNGKTKVTWTDNSNDENGFEIWRKLGSCTSTAEWTIAGKVSANRTFWVDPESSQNKTYSYKVRAYKRTGNMLAAYGFSLFSICCALDTDGDEPPDSTETSLTNKVMLFFYDAHGGCWYSPEAGQNICSSGLTSYRYVPDDGEYTEIINYTDGTFYTSGDRLFSITRRDINSNYFTEIDPITGSELLFDMIPGRPNSNCLAVVNDIFFYADQYKGSFIYRIPLPGSNEFDSGEGIQRTKLNYKYWGNTHTDGSKLYDAYYTGDTYEFDENEVSQNAIRFYERDIKTGEPYLLGEVELEPDFSELYAELYNKVNINIYKGIGYFIRLRLSDNAIEIWKTGFTQVSTEKIFDEIIPDFDGISDFEIDDGYIAFSDRKLIVVFNAESKEYNVYFMNEANFMRIIYVKE